MEETENLELFAEERNLCVHRKDTKDNNIMNFKILYRFFLYTLQWDGLSLKPSQVTVPLNISWKARRLPQELYSFSIGLMPNNLPGQVKHGTDQISCAYAFSSGKCRTYGWGGGRLLHTMHAMRA
jgi:hypothetical protein